MKKIRVAIVLPCFVVGGAENMVYELIKNMDYSKVDVCVICYQGKKNTLLEEKVKELCCNVYYINGFSGVNRHSISSINKLFYMFKPDIIHAHLGGFIMSVPWTITHHCRLVVTLHTTPAQAFDRTIQKIIKVLVSLNKVSLVAISEDNYKKIQNHYRINRNIYCVNNGIDMTRFTRIEHSIFTFINVGRQDKNKNQMLIVSAFEKIYEEEKNVKLILVGNGTESRHLQQYVDAHGLGEVVCFPGEVSTPEDFYAVADVYIQSSHREGLPLSVLEAMSAGLPIISTDVGGIKDIVKENGFLIPDANISALVEKMKKMMCLDYVTKRGMETASKDIVTRYSSKQMAKEYLKVYNMILIKDILE